MPYTEFMSSHLWPDFSKEMLAKAFRNSRRASAASEGSAPNAARDGQAAPSEVREPAPIAPTELSIRVYSALILIAIALFLTVTSVESFAVLITLFISAMAWEWGRLVRGEGFDTAFGVQITATATAALATVQGCPACALLAVIAGTVAVFLIRSAELERPQAWWSAAGVYYAGFPAVALIWIRSDPAYGWLAVLYLFIIVWTTDSAAYLFGRWIGGPKLAPRISPKKTWSW